MAGVIDIRQDPAVDIANAQAIGRIFGAIGRAEALRKKKYDMDTLMGQVAAGEPVQNALQITRESSPAPYDTGLKGLWQRVGNVASLGYRPDVTEDMTERMLMAGLQRELQMQDPMYQAQLEAQRTNTTGAKQGQAQSAEMFPIQKSAAEAGAKVAQAKAAAAPTEIEQGLEAGELDLQGKRANIDNIPIEKKRLLLDNALKQSQLAGDILGQELARENATRGKILESLKVQNIISEEQFNQQMRPLLIDAQKAENKYREALTGYTERRGTGLTPNQRAAILKPMQEALSMTIDPGAAKAWEGIAKSAGFKISQDATGNFVLEDTEGLGPTAGGRPGLPQNPGTPGTPDEQSDYSGVSTDDLLKSLMENPTIR